MAFTVEVYQKETGICIDTIRTTDIRSEGDWYKIYPTHDGDIVGQLSIV